MIPKTTFLPFKTSFYIIMLKVDITNIFKFAKTANITAKNTR